jgi:hypothetical protein
MTYDEILISVLNYTKRRELTSMAQDGIADALRRFHTAAFFPEDLITVKLSSSDVSSIISNYPYQVEGAIGIFAADLISVYSNNSIGYGQEPTSVSNVRKMYQVRALDEEGSPGPELCNVPSDKIITLPKSKTEVFYFYDSKLFIRDPNIVSSSGGAKTYTGNGFLVSFWCYRTPRYVESYEDARISRDWISINYPTALISGACSYVFNMIGDEVSAARQEAKFTTLLLSCCNDLKYAEASNA